LQAPVTEPDLFSYRLIAVCWPPDTDALRDLMPSARVHELDLMEREPLDGLIQEMGITGRFDCYPEGSVILTQLGAIGNLSAALEH
jgi:hypothetical protein